MSSVYIEREERESIDRASEDSVFRFVEPSLNPGAACARKRIRRAPPRFSHCLPSICRFKYICSHLSGPFPDNLYAKRLGSRLRKRCRFSAPFSSLIFDLEKRRVGDSRLEMMISRGISSNFSFWTSYLRSVVITVITVYLRNWFWICGDISLNFSF